MAYQNCHEKWLPNRLESAGHCMALNSDVDSKGVGFVFNGDYSVYGGMYLHTHFNG